MATKRHKPEKIVMKLRQAEVFVGQGMALMDAICEVRMAIIWECTPRKLEQVELAAESLDVWLSGGAPELDIGETELIRFNERR